LGLVLVGLSHKTAPIELREHLTVPAERLNRALSDLRSAHELSEAVILSTCNRLEVYGRPQESRADSLKSVKKFFQTLYPGGAVTSSLYHHEAEDAVRHLFRVASGLDSLVVGETEVLGQVKTAYKFAQTHGATGKITNVLFQRALYVGKHVRQKTAISEGASSVGSVAVRLAERIFGTLDQHRVLLLGAGKMAEITARHLLSQKAGELVIMNRTHARAKELAELLNGKALPMDNLLRELEQADIVICSTSAEKPLITAAMVEPIMKTRRGRSLYFIDIAVPRNVEAAVHNFDNAYVYNVDDLKSLVDENLSRRQQDVSAAETIVNEAAEEFYRWIVSVLQGETPALKHRRA
jgi:glutamyl-tRNA reductase